MFFPFSFGFFFLHQFHFFFMLKMFVLNQSAFVQKLEVGQKRRSSIMCATPPQQMMMRGNTLHMNSPRYLNGEVSSLDKQSTQTKKNYGTFFFSKFILLFPLLFSKRRGTQFWVQWIQARLVVDAGDCNYC